MNPVSYQASLGAAYKENYARESFDLGMWGALRNKIWKALFTLQIDDFKSRMKLYQPSIIINACTSGLKNKVRDTIIEDLYLENEEGSILYEEIFHPSKFNKQKEPFEIRGKDETYKRNTRLSVE